MLARLFGQGAIRLSVMGDLGQLLTQLREVRELRALTGWMNDPKGAYARCFCALELGGSR